MFRRNKDESGPQTGPEETNGGAPPLKPFSKNASHIPSKPPAKAPAISAGSSQRSLESVSPKIRTDHHSHHGEADSKKLIVGRDIRLNGEITSCERLIVEGHIEVTLSDARFIDVAPTGFFKGNAEVKEADISGRFDGELVASDRLIVRAGGKVSGSIRYGSIVIESGGEVTGDMRPLEHSKSQNDTD